MVRQSAGKAAAGGGGGSLKTVVLVAIAVVALGVAGTLVFRHATHEEKSVPDFMPVTCKTCGGKFEVPYEAFRTARDNKQELVGDCPHCGSPQPCYTGDDPDRLPGQMPIFKPPDE